MSVVLVFDLVFLVGLTTCGLFATIIELVAERRLILGEPFVSSRNICRSIVLVLLAGPFMMANEALDALDKGRTGGLAFAGIICLCIVWFVATGTFVVGLTESLRETLG